jgi:hypothetical protein
MPGIISTMAPYDEISVFRIVINDLPLAFIAPLRANHECHGHGFSLPANSTDVHKYNE